MKKTTLLITVLALCSAALAADNAVIAPQSAANPQTAIDNRQSTIISGAEAITIPQMLSYQGKLTDTLGVPVADTLYAVRFRLYAQPSGGTQFWEENQQVRTRSGLFSVLLGSVTPIGSVPDAGALYLGMTVEGGAELAPRLRIVSAAYAYLSARAANADLLQGSDTAALDGRFVNEGQTNSVTGAMLVDGTVQTADMGDTAVTMAKIARAGATTGQVVKWTGSAWAPGQDNTGGGSGVTSVYQDTGIICVPNPISSSGNVKLDLSYSDGRYVNEGQTSSVTSNMIVDGTIAAVDLNQMGASAGQVMKWTGSAWAPRNDSVGGGNGTVRKVTQATGVVCTPNPITDSGTVGFDQTYGDGRYVNVSGDSMTGALAVQGELRSYSRARIGPNCVLGGVNSIAAGDSCVTAGNRAAALGGWHNRAAGADAATVGGAFNLASENYTVCAGYGDSALAKYCGALSGRANMAGTSTTDSASVVSGGYWNTARAPMSFIGGGSYNITQGELSAIAGGSNNHTWGLYGAIAGGSYDSVSAIYGAALSGRGNRAGDGAGDTSAVVCGGSRNRATGIFSSVGGGEDNSAAANGSAVVGGAYNAASGTASFVGGGSSNTASSNTATVAGGASNTATGGSCPTVGGGYFNTASGPYSTVPGGYQCTASGSRSFAAGSYAYARGGGSFVWSDSCGSADSIRNATANRWVARARGGVYFYTSLDKSTGSYLSAGGSSWQSVSDSMTKENFRPVDKKGLLDALVRMRVRDYNLKSQDASIRHIGPVAQDFHSAFGFGESNTAINMEDADGVLLAAVQALYEEVKTDKARIAQLEAELAQQKR